MCALLLLVINDHWLKGAGVLPGWVTGKLSDAAGLVFFPVLLTAIVEGVWPSRWRRSVVAVGSTLATLVVFSLVKAWAPANHVANLFFGTFVLDPTDLVALPALALALFHLLAPPLAPAPRGVQAAAVLVASVASIATSAPMTRRGFAVWQLDRDERIAGCARVMPFVVKSGKEGVGINVRVSTSMPGCAVSIAGVLRAGGHDYPSDPPVSTTAPSHAYLAFVFDDEAVWNDGVRDGELELVVRDASGETRHKFPLRYVHEGDHPWVKHGESRFPTRASAAPLDVPPPRPSLEVPAPRPMGVAP